MWLFFALLPHHRIASLLLAPWNYIESSRQIDYFKTQKLRRRICCRVCLGENLNTRILFTQPIRNNLITDNWQTWWILSGSEILYMFSGIWRKKKEECTKESIAKIQNGKQCHLPLEHSGNWYLDVRHPVSVSEEQRQPWRCEKAFDVNHHPGKKMTSNFRNGGGGRKRGKAVDGRYFMHKLYCPRLLSCSSFPFLPSFRPFPART